MRFFFYCEKDTLQQQTVKDAVGTICSPLHKRDTQRALNRPNNLGVKYLNNCVELGERRSNSITYKMH